MSDVSLPVTTQSSILPYSKIGGHHPNASDNFESFCCELAIVIDGLPRSTTPYGRSGQRQRGLDVRATDPGGARVGLQCKLEAWRSSTAAASDITKWVGEYDEHHDTHHVDRFVLCTPWPNDAPLVELIDAMNAESSRGYLVEHWNGEVLSRFAASHPSIVARYFSASWAAAMAQAGANERAAAFHMGIDTYLDVEAVRGVAMSDAPPDERSAAWLELAGRYRTAGYRGLAVDAEEQGVLARLDGDGGADAIGAALRVAAIALDDLEPSRAESISLRVKKRCGKPLAVIDLVVSALDSPSDEAIAAAVDVVASSVPNLDLDSAVALGLVIGELAEALHHKDAVTVAAQALRPRLVSVRGTFEFARVAALLADADARQIESGDWKHTTPEGRILLSARKGRRLTFAADSGDAIAAYEDSQRSSIQAGLEGPARSARDTIAVIRRWIPPEATMSQAYFAELNADRLLYRSMTAQFGDYPNPEHQAGRAAAQTLRAGPTSRTRPQHVQLTTALILAVRGGFFQEEVERHSELSGWAELIDEPPASCWHALWAADAARARSQAGADTDLDHVIEVLASPVPHFAVAACAALEAASCFATDEQARSARQQLLVPRLWQWGQGPSYGEARIKALAALGPIPMTPDEWDLHTEYVGDTIGRLSQGQPLREFGALLNWLLRHSPDLTRLNALVDTICVACAGTEITATERRAAFDHPLHNLGAERPELAVSLDERWLAATGEPLDGDDTDREQTSDLDHIRSLTPNTNPGVAVGYVVPPIAFVNARRWTDTEFREALEALIAVAASPLDTSMTRRSVLRVTQQLAEHLDVPISIRQEFSTRFRELAETVRDTPADRFQWFDDRPLWPGALHASLSLGDAGLDAWAQERVVELLASTEGEDQLKGGQMAALLAGYGCNPTLVKFLVAQSGVRLRRYAVEIAVRSDPMDADVLDTARSDTSWEVRMAVVAQLDRVAERDAGLADSLRGRLRNDPNALVRWRAGAT